MDQATVSGGLANRGKRRPRWSGVCPLLWAASFAAVVAAAEPPPLARMYADAWARQPEAQSASWRHEASTARRRMAESWSADAPALEVSGKADRLGRGAGEYVLGLAVPLWLPGERQRNLALVDAEAQVEVGRVLAAQWRTAGQVRAAWWSWLLADSERRSADARLDGLRRLADDVTRRIRVGELARVDGHQAGAAVAAAEIALADAESQWQAAALSLRVLTGTAPDPAADGSPEVVPAVDAGALVDSSHPALAEWASRRDAAQRRAALAEMRTRNTPELTVSSVLERAAVGESMQQSVFIGMRWPLGQENRQRSILGQARAEVVETEMQWVLEQERVAAAVMAARAQFDAARRRLTAAEQRARLASEARLFVEKSFRLGESDLPTRLRIELEAGDAGRQADRYRLEAAAAVSVLRQAMGLLPE